MVVDLSFSSTVIRWRSLPSTIGILGWNVTRKPLSFGLLPTVTGGDVYRSPRPPPPCISHTFLPTRYVRTYSVSELSLSFCQMSGNPPSPDTHTKLETPRWRGPGKGRKPAPPPGRGVILPPSNGVTRPFVFSSWYIVWRGQLFFRTSFHPLICPPCIPRFPSGGGCIAVRGEGVLLLNRKLGAKEQVDNR